MQIFEGHNVTYGVGMPVMITFSKPVENKKAVERALVLKTSRPVVGAWYWDGDQALWFRPRAYWPQNTKVSFIGHFDGVQLSPGVYATHTLRQDFRIGRSLIVVASASGHTMKVYKERKLFATWPISTGRPGKDTPNGTYLSIEKANPQHMVGEDYDIQVPYSVRFTWSGDFIHAAPWSVGSQGFANVSHGCVNVAPANAQTYYGMSIPGDPVTVTGSPKGGSWDDGYTVWFLSWKDLVKGSAMHKAMRVGPDGSTWVRPSDLKKSHAKAPLGRPKPENARPLPRPLLIGDGGRPPQWRAPTRRSAAPSPRQAPAARRASRLRSGVARGLGLPRSPFVALIFRRVDEMATQKRRDEERAHGEQAGAYGAVLGPTDLLPDRPFTDPEHTAGDALVMSMMLAREREIARTWSRDVEGPGHLGDAHRRRPLHARRPRRPSAARGPRRHGHRVLRPAPAPASTTPSCSSTSAASRRRSRRSRPSGSSATSTSAPSTGATAT